jgi:hypothetical protein
VFETIVVILTTLIVFLQADTVSPKEIATHLGTALSLMNSSPSQATVADAIITQETTTPTTTPSPKSVKSSPSPTPADSAPLVVLGVGTVLDEEKPTPTPEPTQEPTPTPTLPPIVSPYPEPTPFDPPFPFPTCPPPVYYPTQDGKNFSEKKLILCPPYFPEQY